MSCYILYLAKMTSSRHEDTRIISSQQTKRREFGSHRPELEKAFQEVKQNKQKKTPERNLDLHKGVKHTRNETHMRKFL